MCFLLQRYVERAYLLMVLETYFRLVGKLGSESLVEDEDFFLTAYEGDFALMVTVYRCSTADEEALARFLARTLHTKVVISDDDVNPYTWVLVDESGIAQPFWEDPVDRECFFVVAERYRHLLVPCPTAQPTEGK